MRGLGWALAMLCIAGCGAGGSSASDNRNGAGVQAPGAPGFGGSSGSAGAGFGSPTTTKTGIAASGSGSGGAAAPVLPPEMKVQIDFQQPQASDRFVYAANPDMGTVSIIDATSQAIQTVETGDHPTFLRTLAGTDDAIVLNVGSDQATILRSPATGVALAQIDVVHGANAIAVAPDGKHAVVYFQTVSGSTAAPTGSVLQDVTVITLDPGLDPRKAGIGMTVGFRPRAVSFAKDSSQAYVVTDDGISVLDFASIEKSGTGIARLVSLGSDVDQTSLDVSVTPDGKYALAREPAKSAIRLVKLSDGSTRVLDLAMFDTKGGDDTDGGVAKNPTADVSDLELAPDGTFAMAALRDQSIALRIPVPDAFEKSEKVKAFPIKGEIVGTISIAPQSDAALIYTTAVDVERITRVSLSDGKYKVVALRKTIKAVTIAPDGQTALIIHKKADGDPNQAGLDPETQINRSFGYSVLRIPTGDVKLEVTPVEPTAFTMVPDGSFLFLLLRDDGNAVREVQKVEAKSFLITTIALGSPPISIGAVPKSQRVFVNQDHPDGRITFIDWMTNDTRTVTGFELNSRIRD
jgi:hypothetical protein